MPIPSLKGCRNRIRVLSIDKGLRSWLSIVLAYLMSLIGEKSLVLSRLFSCLIAISMLLLIFSTLFLFQFNEISLVPSVFNIININSSSVYFRPNVRSEHIQKPPLASPFLTNEPTRSQGICDVNHAVLRVYMYDLPPEFHFGLMGWSRSGNQVWPDVRNRTQIPQYPGGLNLQHSMEYWLTLDLLSSNAPDVVRPCTVVRVPKPDQADIMFVPFFSSLSYNRFSKLRGEETVSVNSVLQDRLVEFLEGRDEWKRKKGKDHLIVSHHPNSMLTARTKLGSAMFILADFGRYPVEIANLNKDVIAPYKHIIKTTPASKSYTYEDRPILVYFQGAIYRKDGGAVRQELYYLLKDEKDVHFTFGSVGANGVSQAGRGMATSKFCLNIAGDTPSSNRLFDAIATHCVPVIISDDIELPFEDVLDYSTFCIFIRASDALKKDFLLNLLRGIKQDRWTKMWEKLKEVEKHFEYQFPSRPGDAVDMIWGAVSRKLSSYKNEIHRKNRYHKSQL